jgi:hypothetical protein
MGIKKALQGKKNRVAMSAAKVAEMDHEEELERATRKLDALESLAATSRARLQVAREMNNNIIALTSAVTAAAGSQQPTSEGASAGLAETFSSFVDSYNKVVSNIDLNPLIGTG